MSGDIIDGLDQLLNQSTEDILPYYQKTETTPDTAYENLHESYYSQLSIIAHLVIAQNSVIAQKRC